MNNEIFSFWISGALQPVNLLTLRSFAEHGHRLIIYTYEPEVFNSAINNQQSAFELRDANEILPASEIFYYKRMMGGNPNFKFGGIAERLKAEMLYQLGGWHVDLDVTCLRNFNELKTYFNWKLETDYIFKPHLKGIVANIIKAPKGSDFARRYVEITKTIDENNRIWEKGFMGLNGVIEQLNLQQFIVPESIFGNDTDPYWKNFLTSNIKHQTLNSLFAIHWCAAMGENYERGSFYHQLLNKYSIINQYTKMASQE